MIFIRASIWYALSRLITTFRTAIEKHVTMVTEPTLKSEEMMRIFHRIDFQRNPSFKRLPPMPCGLRTFYSIGETVCRQHGTVCTLQRIGIHLAHNILWEERTRRLGVSECSSVFCEKNTERPHGLETPNLCTGGARMWTTFRLSSGMCDEQCGGQSKQFGHLHWTTRAYESVTGALTSVRAWTVQYPGDRCGHSFVCVLQQQSDLRHLGIRKHMRGRRQSKSS